MFSMPRTIRNNRLGTLHHAEIDRGRRQSARRYASDQFPQDLTQISGHYLHQAALVDLQPSPGDQHARRCLFPQITNLLHLAPDILEEIHHLLRVTESKDPIYEKLLRPIAAEVDWGRQRDMWMEIEAD